MVCCTGEMGPDCFNRIPLAAEKNSLSGGKVEAGRMWIYFEAQASNFS